MTEAVKKRITQILESTEGSAFIRCNYWGCADYTIRGVITSEQKSKCSPGSPMSIDTLTKVLNGNISSTYIGVWITGENYPEIPGLPIYTKEFFRDIDQKLIWFQL